jgi:hypothetical protein
VTGVIVYQKSRVLGAGLLDRVLAARKAALGVADLGGTTCVAIDPASLHSAP